jgi:DNA-binding Lrp family transcriptional regulator
MATLDDLDRRLIGLLRSDARLAVSSLAAALGVARATVKNRMERLERSGVILGYSARLNEQSDAGQVRAIMSLKVQGKAANNVLRTIKGFPEVASMHTTNGRWDVIIEIRVSNLQEFETALRRIRLIDGIVSTETNILLSQQK